MLHPSSEFLRACPVSMLYPSTLQASDLEPIEKHCQEPHPPITGSLSMAAIFSNQVLYSHRTSGCWRGGQPPVCPHCGNRGRAAPLGDPPAEVQDYLQARECKDTYAFWFSLAGLVASQKHHSPHWSSTDYSARTYRENRST